MKNANFLLLICAFFLSGCGGVTPVPTIHDSVEPKITPEVIVTHPELEIISPENITKLTQIARWGDGKIYDVAISPDNQTVAISMIDGIHLYNSVTLIERQFIKREIFNTADLSLPISFSPDGNYLAISSGMGVSLLNLSTNEYDRSLLSAIPDLNIVDIQISHDNNHIILYTSGGYYPCDGLGGNYALYDISEKYGQLIFDRYFCNDHSGSVSRFTQDGKAYFFYWYLTSPLPYAMDIVDLSTNRLIESVSYGKIDFDPLRVFYDVSPDGKTIASLEYKDNKSITRFIDTETGKVTQTIDGVVLFETISQEGELVWRDKWKRFNPPEDETCKIILDDVDSYQKVISSGNVSTFIIFHFGSPQSLELWDTSNCEKNKEVSFTSADGIVFSPDGQLFVTRNGYNLNVWDVKTGQIRFSATGTQFRFPVDTFAFSKDSRLLFTGTYGRENAFFPSQPYKKYSVAVWDTQTGKQVNIIESDNDFLRNIATGNNKEIVAISDSSSINFLNIKSGKLLTSTPSGIFDFTNDGDSVWLVHGEKEQPNTITLFDILTGEKIREFQTPYLYIQGMSLSKDNSRIALMILNNEKGHHSTVILDSETGTELYKSQLDIPFHRFISNGTFFATHGSNGYIDLWNFQSELPFQRIYGYHSLEKAKDPPKYDFGPYDYVSLVAFSPKDDFIISLGSPNNLRLWNIQTGNLLAEIEPNFRIPTLNDNAIAISPDGRLIVLTGTDGMIRLWGVPNQ